MHDFKWTAFLDGPVFLLSCYYEALILVEIAANGEPNYNGAVIVRLKVFQALTIYGFTVFGQFMQQKDLSVAIIQKQLLA